jgi:hypothetical protein
LIFRFLISFSPSVISSFPASFHLSLLLTWRPLEIRISVQEYFTHFFLHEEYWFNIYLCTIDGKVSCQK